MGHHEEQGELPATPASFEVWAVVLGGLRAASTSTHREFETRDVGHPESGKPNIVRLGSHPLAQYRLAGLSAAANTQCSPLKGPQLSPSAVDSKIIFDSIYISFLSVHSADPLLIFRRRPWVNDEGHLQR